MQLELRHLKAVCAIAEAGSVSKAASVLGLAQPALSAQLTRIESALGGCLFERDRRGARPTALGELVLARARVLLPVMSELQQEARRFAGEAETVGRFRIGSTGCPFLTGFVRRLEERFPTALVTTHSSWSADELAGLVAQGRADFVLAGVCGDAAPPRVEGLVWCTVSADPVFVLLPEDHPCARLDEVDLRALADVKWAVTPGDGCFETCFATACARAGFTPAAIYEVDAVSCIELAHSGSAVALCQPMFRQTAGLVAAPIAGAPLMWRHVLGWHARSPVAALADRVVRHAKAAHADVLGRNPRYPAWLARHPRFAPVA
ncbi:DNA-binding transcriptional LysR family regulator [Prauserella shujinwangii]|uniref:DNA-binding transcriptional LysR family regulator n=1 Tax=Prauserella shujinwangii TaxID=1453103 RepID=A0A2T0LKL9_9PSEU|nr:LysR family transcriptional regulator [Prauserella shujinwangii]PRX43449.1 DNA-binding transcriptional LysR family regulator [Prauserella shujinwangii]